MAADRGGAGGSVRYRTAAKKVRAMPAQQSVRYGGGGGTNYQQLAQQAAQRNQEEQDRYLYGAGQDQRGRGRGSYHLPNMPAPDETMATGTVEGVAGYGLRGRGRGMYHVQSAPYQYSQNPNGIGVGYANQYQMNQAIAGQRALAQAMYNRTHPVYSQNPNGIGVGYRNQAEMNAALQNQYAMNRQMYDRNFGWRKELAAERVYDKYGNMTMGPGTQVWGKGSYIPPTTPSTGGGGGGGGYGWPSYGGGGGGGGYTQTPEWWLRMLSWNFG